MHRLSRKLALVGGLLGLMSAGLTTGVVTPASASHHPVPTGYTAYAPGVCGTTLTTAGSYALTADIGPCDATTAWGIRITADNVNLDLNGHDIIGCNNPNPTGCNAPIVGPPPGDGAYTIGEGAGILLENVKNTLVTNSRATWNAATGVDSPGSLSGSVSDVLFFDQGLAATNVGGACPDATVGGSTGPPRVQAHTKPNCNNTVSKIRFAASIGTITTANPTGEGIVFDESGGNTIENNVVDHSGPYAGIAIYDDPFTACDPAGAPTGFTAGICSRGNKIVENTVTDSNTQTNGTSFQTTGIRLEPRVNHTQVVGNTVDNSSLNGIGLFATTHSNTVHGNFVTDNGFHYGTSNSNPASKVQDVPHNDKDEKDPIHGDGSGPYVRANHVLGDGIKLFAGSNDNHITANVVCGNAGNGIHVSAAAGVQPAPAGNTISGNTAGGTLTAWKNPGQYSHSGGPCGSRVENRCPVESGAAVTGGQGCSKNNVGKDANSPAYDLKDGTGGCSTNTWSSNTWGNNSWPNQSASGSAALDDQRRDGTNPPASSCVQ